MRGIARQCHIMCLGRVKISPKKKPAPDHAAESAVSTVSPLRVLSVYAFTRIESEPRYRNITLTIEYLLRDLRRFKRCIIFFV